MRADDLHDAVGSIARILESAEIRQAVDRFRAARGDDRPVAAARLGHAGAVISERFQRLGPVERSVIRSLHLEDLAKPAYWHALIATAGRPGPGNGEVVRLAARLMFTSQNLPGLIGLLKSVDSGGVTAPRNGEGRLRMRLMDAGERASDPDRIARAIDGIDMLYSACASLARRPAIDLRLDAVDGDDARDLHFTGGSEAVAAIARIIQSIPGAIAELDESAEIELDDIVDRLPVFEHLGTVADGGSFPDTDLKNISETLRQGALLVLESGVAYVSPEPARPAAARVAGSDARSQSAPAAAAPPARAPAPVPRSDDQIETLTQRHTPTQAQSDRHYDEYLRERAAMQGAAPVSAPSARSNGRAHVDTMPDSELATAKVRDTASETGKRQANVEDMLAMLKSQRGKG